MSFEEYFLIFQIVKRKVKVVFVLAHTAPFVGSHNSNHYQNVPFIDPDTPIVQIDFGSNFYSFYLELVLLIY